MILLSMGFGLLAGLLGIPIHDLTHAQAEEYGAGTALFILVAFIVLLYAQLAIYAKRFHDRGKSGWWSLVAFIPVIGVFWILIELGMLPGDPGPNAYGMPEEGAAVPA